jgi:hypothetical protein
MRVSKPSIPGSFPRSTGRGLRAGLLAAVAAIAVSPAFATPFTVSTVPPDANATSAKTLANGETGTVTSSGILQVSSDPVITLQGGATITNSGTIQSTNAANGRAIRQNTAGNFSISLTNNAGALITSNGDTFQINKNTGTGTVTVTNAGTIRSVGTGANNGQALDFDADTTTTGSITITNQATGIISSADADAIRPGNRSVVNNAGQIISSFTTANAPTGNDSGNDGVQFGSNTGTVNNLAGGSITAARHGITGDKGVTINNAGTITGADGSGINIDTTVTADTTTISNHGTITGNAATADGDGIDVDRTVALDNFGTIRAAGIAQGGNINEALAVGGGTINNFAGATIRSDQRAITVDDSNLGNAFAATTINNHGTIRGDNGEAIKITSTFANTLLNDGTILGSVVMGAGDDTVKLGPGSIIQGLIDGGAGIDTIEILDPPATSVHLGLTEDFEKLLIDDGAFLVLDATQNIDEVVGVTFAPDGSVANIFGDGHDIFYDPFDPVNAYLNGGNFALQDGGFLLRNAPEPMTLGLFAPGLYFLLARKGRRASLNSRRRSGWCM